MATIKLQGLDQFAHVMYKLSYGAYHKHLLGVLTALGSRASLAAKGTLGSGYGIYGTWAPLAPSTIERKRAARQGLHNNPASILYAIGAMRASIGFKVNASQLSVTVGSNSPYAIYHELGTSRMPARPFLMPAALYAVRKSLPDIEKCTAFGIMGIGGTGIGHFSDSRYGSVQLGNFAEY